jgi:imidazolonepropionase-like amidohydrolase
MSCRIRALLYVTILLALIAACAVPPPASGPQFPHNIALVNGKWFDGESFETRNVYSVDGRFVFSKPARVDRTIDLTGMWIVPPFGEAHNHNINGIEERDRNAIQRFLSDGVFYVKIPGNLPLTDEVKRSLPLNRPDGIDAVFSHGAMLTASGGHPQMLADLIWLRPGYFPGHTKETLKDHRYFTIDSEEELENKWPQIIGQRPDFIKVILWHSEEFEKRKNDAAYYGQYGLDPRLLPTVVAKARATGLKVSAHVSDAADFRAAVEAGVDEIAHLPLSGLIPIGGTEARLAAERGIVVNTTCGIVRTLPPQILPRDTLPQALQTQLANLKLLGQSGVTLAIGSDNVTDSSVGELEYLQGLGIFDNLALLKMWAETTPRTIFPNRRIGALSEGYEASFLALEGNPVEDLKNVRRIRLRFKQGFPLEP